MKHLLTKHIYLKQCAVTYLLHLLAPAPTVVELTVEIHSRDTALIRNHKSTLFACALV